MTAVSTTSIVNTMQDLIEEVRSDKKLDAEKRVKLITSLADRQLRAGALNLAYQRAVARLPEGSDSIIPQLNAPESGADKGARKQ